MLKAQDSADQIIGAVEGEVKNLLVNEGKDNIDDKVEEIRKRLTKQRRNRKNSRKRLTKSARKEKSRKRLLRDRQRLTS